jgi:hypothetical protein
LYNIKQIVKRKKASDEQTFLFLVVLVMLHRTTPIIIHKL